MKRVMGWTGVVLPLPTTRSDRVLYQRYQRYQRPPLPPWPLGRITKPEQPYDENDDSDPPQGLECETGAEVDQGEEKNKRMGSSAGQSPPRSTPLAFL